VEIEFEKQQKDVEAYKKNLMNTFMETKTTFYPQPISYSNRVKNIFSFLIIDVALYLLLLIIISFVLYSFFAIIFFGTIGKLNLFWLPIFVIVPLILCHPIFISIMVLIVTLYIIYRVFIASSIKALTIDTENKSITLVMLNSKKNESIEIQELVMTNFLEFIFIGKEDLSSKGKKKLYNTPTGIRFNKSTFQKTDLEKIYQILCECGVVEKKISWFHFLLRAVAGGIAHMQF